MRLLHVVMLMMIVPAGCARPLVDVPLVAEAPDASPQTPVASVAPGCESGKRPDGGLFVLCAGEAPSAADFNAVLRQAEGAPARTLFSVARGMGVSPVELGAIRPASARSGGSEQVATSPAQFVIAQGRRFRVARAPDGDAVLFVETPK